MSIWVLLLLHTTLPWSRALQQVSLGWVSRPATPHLGARPRLSCCRGASVVQAPSPPLYGNNNNDVPPPQRRFMPLVEELAGDIRVQKLAVWVAFFGVIKLLKPFYSIIFATFVLAFVGSSFVDRTQRLYVSCARAIVTRLSGLRRRGESSDKSWAREILKRLEYSRGRTILPRALVPPRKAFAALYISSVLLAATTVFVRYGPVIARESQYFTAALTKEDPYLAAATAITATLGTHRVEQLDALLRSIADNEDFFSLATSHKPVSVRALSESLRHLISPQLVKLGALSSALLRPVPSLIYEVLTAMLFSFLIVWDLPLIGRAFSHLGRARTSWVRFAYAEISPRIRSFSRLLGTNFEITGLIAIVNTLLTTLGFLVLDISGTRFLGFLVFVCSFVPVVGVFVSTIPACILALVEHGGQRLAQVVGMVIFVHFVEAYLLYPQIYATKLKVHPLLVLVVLYAFEHVVGWKGLFVALPVSVFFMQVLLGDDTSDDPVSSEPSPLAAKTQPTSESIPPRQQTMPPA